MARIICLLLAAISLHASAAPSGRPRYGGELRLQMRAELQTLDPETRPPERFMRDARADLLPLVFDTLVRYDDRGQPAPSLAVSWRQEADGKRWRFRIRSGVHFHDDTVLTAAAVAASLEKTSSEWKAMPSGEEVLVTADRSLTHLLDELAGAERSIFRRLPDGSLAGTGPFRMSEGTGRGRIALRANERYWAGRPFLDGVVIQTGRSLKDQLLDFELERADVVEISPSEFRQAEQRGIELEKSLPSGLMALVFARDRTRTEELSVRRALAHSIDRDMIHSILLQGQGETATGLLPNWLSGYASLFSPGREAQPAARLSPTQPALLLAHENFDPVAKTVADRIALNARQAGVTVQVLPYRPDAPASARAPDLHLVRAQIRARRPHAAVAELQAELRGSTDQVLPESSSLEDLYRHEKSLLEEYRIVPLFHLPSIYAVHPRIRVRVPPPLRITGGWKFEEVWLDRGRL